MICYLYLFGAEQLKRSYVVRSKVWNLLKEGAEHGVNFFSDLIIYQSKKFFFIDKPNTFTT